MSKHFDKIKRDAEERVLKNNDGNQEFLLYLDHTTYQAGEALDIVTAKIEFERPTTVVFVDDEPGMNFGHRCHYLLYDAESGAFIRKVPAAFPHFHRKQQETVELFRTCGTIERFKRKKRLGVLLEPAKLSAYAKLMPLPLRFTIQGCRYAILYSGGSNGRHVNDLEFLYRTLVDVYGYDPANIYVLNYDGTVNYDQMWWETPPSDGFAPDGSPWRMVVNGQATRTAFQQVINDLTLQMHSHDCLFIHTNNHGWYDGNGSFMSAYDGVYYATDFAADLALLPHFRTLLVVMEQCASGGFATPVLNQSPATNTVFQAAVPGDETSAGGWPFDPWAEMWISAMAGVRGDGSALALSPDADLNSLISSREAYDFAIAIDNPVISESSANLSKKVYLCRCQTTLKRLKEWKEWKEWKELKEYKEPKEWHEPKVVFEPKLAYEPKAGMEPKPYEGPEVELPIEDLRASHAELEERVQRLEEAARKLQPFVPKEQRPEVKPKRARPKK